MMVLATNRPSDLDAAVADRVDEHIQFDLPGQTERERLVHLYFHKYIGDGNFRLTYDAAIDEAMLVRVAAQLEGFSGRAISKLMISAQGAAYGAADGVLSKEALEEVVAIKVAQRKRQEELREGGAVEGWS